MRRPMILAVTLLLVLGLTLTYIQFKQGSDEIRREIVRTNQQGWDQQDTALFATIHVQRTLTAAP